MGIHPALSLHQESNHVLNGLKELPMKVVIIIPTYNERENIQVLIPELDQQFRLMDHECQLLVVDDNSPDGTAEAVRILQQKYHHLHLITGEKNGLGAAYIRGMKHAMEMLQADVVFEMDADFSHKPEDVPRLMAEIDAGADFVIGSRYVPGGTIPKEWGWHRKLNSWGGNAVARNVAGIYGVRDCTAGFRSIRTSLLHKIDLSDLRVQGYAFQVSLLHAAKTAGARIKEIPVDFVERSRGESKLGLRDVIEFITHAGWIRFRSSKTFIKFGLVGLSGVAVNLLFFTLFLMMGINKYLASPLAIELSIVSNFMFNNYWTFRARNSADRIRVRGIKFNLVSLLSLIVSYGTFILLTANFPHVVPQVHQLIGIIPATLVNYFMNSRWTFKHVAEDERDLGKDKNSIHDFLAECADSPGAKLIGLVASYLILFILVAYPIVIIQHPPINDYANHLVRMYLLHHADSAPVDRFYQVDWNLIPNLAMDLTVPVLTNVLPLAQAGKVYILFVFALLTSGALFLHWVLYKRLSAIPLVTFLFLYNRAFLMGFVNFLGGCGLAIWALAFWLCIRDKGTATKLAVGTLMSGLMYFAHLHAFGVYAIVVTVYEIASLNKLSAPSWKAKMAAIWPALFQFVPWAILFLLITAPGSGGEGNTMYLRPIYKMLIGKALIPSYQSFFDGASTLLLFAGGAMGFFWGRAHLDKRLVCGLSALMLVVLILPGKMLGGAQGDWRLLVPITFIACAMIRLDRKPKESESYGITAMTTAALIFIVMLRVLFVTSQWKVADKFYSDFQKVIQHGETGSRLFPAVINMSYDEATMIFGVLHLPTFAVLERQMFVPTVFALPMQQPIKINPELVPILPLKITNGLYGAFSLPCELIRKEYDYLLLIDPKDDGETKACGLQRVDKSGAIELYRVGRNQNG